MAVAAVAGKTFHYSFARPMRRAARRDTRQCLNWAPSVKLYAGVIGAMALERGDIKLTDPVAKHWPALTSPQWQQLNMQHLATYTAGGLPLFMPDSVIDDASLLAYYQQWQPQYPAGTQRVYANSSIGLFAHLPPLPAVHLMLWHFPS